MSIEHDVQKKCPNKMPFTNYVYKRRGVGGQTNPLFVKFYTIENLNKGGVGGQKKQNLVNLVCERSLIRFHIINSNSKN